jgi:hypothetical protein
VTCRSRLDAGTCCSSGSSRSRVWIGPGYAVDCCGNDLVLCRPLEVDLSGICRPDDDPCADPCPPPPPPDPADGAILRKRDGLKLGGWTVPGDEVVIVDLSLRYGEQPSAGQRAMFRSGCSGESACEYTRMVEQPEAVLRVISADDDPVARAASERDASRASALAEAKTRIAALAEGTVEEVLQRLRRYPVYTLCYVTDFVQAQLEREQEGWRELLQRYLLLDWLQHEAQCACAGCRSDQGVPLARLLLWRKDGRADCCRVLLIRNAPPWRRLIQPDCQPVVPGRVAIDNLIGQRIDLVRDHLARENIELKEPGAPVKAASINGRGFVEVGGTFKPQTIDLLGERYFVGLTNP